MAVIGVNTFLWTVTWEKGLYQTLAKIREIGFDAVQIPLIGLDSLKPKELCKAIRELNLRCYISAGLRDQTDITSDDPQIRRQGIDYLKHCVCFARQVGAPFLSGSFHSVFGKKLDRPVSQAYWQRAADSLHQVAEEAQRQNYCLALEPINRYESFLINTTEQARKLIDMIDLDNVKIQLDTFHMNIEEDDPYRAIALAGSDLIHFHVAENHRGRFGFGTIFWDGVFQALAGIQYRGAIVIESFVPQVPEVATAAAIWREMAPSADVLAREGLEFMKALVAKHQL